MYSNWYSNCVTLTHCLHVHHNNTDLCAYMHASVVYAQPCNVHVCTRAVIVNVFKA